MANREQREAFPCFNGASVMTFAIQVTASFIGGYVTEFEKHIQSESFAMFLVLHVAFSDLFV